VLLRERQFPAREVRTGGRRIRLARGGGAAGWYGARRADAPLAACTWQEPVRARARRDDDAALRQLCRNGTSTAESADGDPPGQRPRRSASRAQRPAARGWLRPAVHSRLARRPRTRVRPRRDPRDARPARAVPRGSHGPRLDRPAGQRRCAATVRNAARAWSATGPGERARAHDRARARSRRCGELECRRARAVGAVPP
jgi:hypothetical protein